MAHRCISRQDTTELAAYLLKFFHGLDGTPWSPLAWLNHYTSLTRRLYGVDVCQSVVTS